MTAHHVPTGKRRPWTAALRPTGRRLITSLIGVVVIGSTLTATAPDAQAGPRAHFQMPFPCHAKWDGATYDGHGTSSADGQRGNDFAIDFNKDGTSGNADFSKPVVASAAGTARVLRDSGGLGRYVRISHANGWKTYYAHLSKAIIRDGAHVRKGQRIGRVGHSGNAPTAHLHYEQRRNGHSKFIHFNGKRLKPGYSYTYNGPTYTSRNCRLQGF